MTDNLRHAVDLARLCLRFARVERATFHEDGLRKETDADHTIMLAIVAAEAAPRGMSKARVADSEQLGRIGATHGNDPWIALAIDLLAESMLASEAAWT